MLDKKASSKDLSLDKNALLITGYHRDLEDSGTGKNHTRRVQSPDLFNICTCTLGRNSGTSRASELPHWWTGPVNWSERLDFADLEIADGERQLIEKVSVATLAKL